MSIAEELATVRRRSIIDAASRVFARSGLQGASMRAIAAEAGVTTGAIYPLFRGKEEIYAALLEDTLKRLYADMASSVAETADGPAALRNSAHAFVDYFLARMFDFELGLYLFRGLERGGLGKERDAILNAELLRCLNIFATAIKRTAPALSVERCDDERDALFAALIGVLILAYTGRTDSIGTTNARLVDSHLNGLIERLTK